MTPEQRQDFFEKTERMQPEELRRRVKDCKFLVDALERSIEQYQFVLNNPEKAQKEIIEMKERITEMKERQAIFYIRLKGLLC